MEVDCIACGKKMAVEGIELGENAIVECPHCRYRFRVFMPADVGAETLFQARVLTEEITDDEAASDGSGEEIGALTVRVGSGTVLLGSKDLEPPGTPLDTAVRAFLIHAATSSDVERRPLTLPRTVVGREGADVIIDDPALSGRHFEVEVRGGDFFLRDLDSSNGTFLNGEKIRSAQLADGDTIQAGKSKLTFRLMEVVRWDAPDEAASQDRE